MGGCGPFGSQRHDGGMFRGLARIRWLAAALAALALLVTGCGASSGSTADTTTSNGVATVPKQKAGMHGDPLTPAPALPAVTFTDTAGKAYDLRTQPTKRLFLLFFGYTRCPDVCPTTMADLAAALHQLPASVDDQVSVGFITVDPKHDTPRVLRAWLDHFDRSFIGLTGFSATVEKAQRALGLPVLPLAQQVTNHSAEVLVFGPDKRAHTVYTAATSAQDFATDLPVLVKQAR